MFFQKEVILITFVSEEKQLPLSMGHLVTPPDGDCFFHSLKENLEYQVSISSSRELNRPILSIRNDWSETGKSLMKAFQDTNDLEWCRDWDELKKAGTYHTTYSAGDLIVPLAAHICKRHIYIINEMTDSDTGVKKHVPFFVSGNSILQDNVSEQCPLLMCRVDKPSPHYQSLKSDDYNYWREYSMKELNLNVSLEENIESSKINADENLTKINKCKVCGKNAQDSILRHLSKSLGCDFKYTKSEKDEIKKLKKKERNKQYQAKRKISDVDFLEAEKERVAAIRRKKSEDMQYRTAENQRIQNIRKKKSEDMQYKTAENRRLADWMKKKNQNLEYRESENNRIAAVMKRKSQDLNWREKENQRVKKTKVLSIKKINSNRTENSRYMKF